MTAPGGDSGENPRGNPNQPWADAGAPAPDQGGWPYPPAPEGYPPAPGYPPPGFPPPPPPGNYLPPGGYLPPTPPAPLGPGEYPGFGGPPGYPPAGYSNPPGYPPSGYGTPYPGSYFNPGQAQKTNVLAVSSLVVSLLGLVFWPLGVAGVILGGVALNQIKSTGEAGHGMAVAGTAIGGVAVTLSLILAMIALN
ncbi:MULTISPECIES: DUF4190 domain-containing protein [unclassified Mycobacterium]|uniref:DUF4190 domain-containing protein n=1 Tax=unclassified Mycobacterium TaxID=2642494 RepID=UPI0003FEE286|nr:MULTISPECIES: DUF4190 domain-containing protein [unclassified Mycobacterium]